MVGNRANGGCAGGDKDHLSAQVYVNSAADHGERAEEKKDQVEAVKLLMVLLFGAAVAFTIGGEPECAVNCVMQRFVNRNEQREEHCRVDECYGNAGNISALRFNTCEKSVISVIVFKNFEKKCLQK